MSLGSILTVIALAAISTVVATSAEARSLTNAENLGGGDPWLSLGIILVTAAALFAAMTWGDKRKPYKA